MADVTVPILKRVHELLEQRGWTQHYSMYSYHNGGPLNIRLAVTKAVDEVADGSTEAQISILQTLALQLGGITDWETRKSRTHEQVVDKIARIVTVLESDEKQDPSGRRSHRREFGRQPAGKQPSAGDAAARPSAF